MHALTLEFWLSRFVVEARKQDGSEYPAKSLYYLVCGLLRLLRNKEIYSMNFLDEKDIRFANFRKVLDSRIKELVHTGVGTTVKQAEVILPEHEEKLWETGEFGDHSAESLQHTVYYYSCKIFGLRSCDEHQSLECTQFTVGKDDGDKKYIRFVGRSNKTYKGGLAQIQLKVSKVAKIRKRYNQVPHLTQDTHGKVTNSQKTAQTRAKRSALSQQVTTKHI